MQQIDRIVVVDIDLLGVGESNARSDLIQNFLQQVLDLGDKLHKHLHVTMPSNNYW